MIRLSKDMLQHVSDCLKEPVISTHLLPGFSLGDSKHSFSVVYLKKSQKYVKVYIKSDLVNKGIDEYNNVLSDGCNHSEDEFSLGARVLGMRDGGDWATTYLKQWSTLYSKHVLPVITSEITRWNWLPYCILETDMCILYEWVDEAEYRPARFEDMYNGDMTDLFRDIIKQQHEFHVDNKIDMSRESIEIQQAYDSMNQTRAMRDRWVSKGDWCLSFEYNYISDIYINKHDPRIWKYVDIENIWVHKPNHRYIIKHSTTTSENGNTLSEYINTNNIDTISNVYVFYYIGDGWSHIKLDDVL